MFDRWAEGAAEKIQLSPMFPSAGRRGRDYSVQRSAHFAHIMREIRDTRLAGLEFSTKVLCSQVRRWFEKRVTSPPAPLHRMERGAKQCGESDDEAEAIAAKGEEFKNRRIAARPGERSINPH